MANDKISLMTAAGAGDLAGTTTRIEVTTLYTTVPATLGSTLALLRTTMFAGGSGYTATDPITAGAASFTTLAASGAATLSSTLRVNGVASQGAAASTDSAYYLHGASGMAGTTQYGLFEDVAVTSAATTAAWGIAAKSATAAAAFTVTNSGAFYARAPELGAASAITNQHGLYVVNQGAAGITNAYGVYIAAQSGAATTNMALYNAGKSQLMGAVGIGKAPTATSPFCATGIPTSSAGLASGDFWLNSNVLTIVP